MEIRFQADGCHGQANVIDVPYAHAAKQLPAGMTPRDFGSLFQNEPAQTGRVPVFLAAMRCEDILGDPYGSRNMSHAFAAIFIEPPQGLGDHEPAFYEMYVPESYISGDGLRGMKQVLHWPYKDANIIHSALHLSTGGGSFTTTIEGKNGTLGVIRSASASPIPQQPTGVGIGDWDLRTWHVGPHGTSSFTFDFRYDVNLGIGRYCAQPEFYVEDSQQPCAEDGRSPPGAAIGILFPDFRMNVTAWHGPGLFPN